MYFLGVECANGVVLSSLNLNVKNSMFLERLFLGKEIWGEDCIVLVYGGKYYVH